MDGQKWASNADLIRHHKAMALPKADVHCLRAADKRVCNASMTTLDQGKTHQHYCFKDSDHPEERHVCSCFWVWTGGVGICGSSGQ